MKKLLSVLSLADLILVLGLIVLSLLIVLLPRTRDEELFVAVIKDNILIAEYPLDKDNIYTLDEHNSLEVRDNKVRMLKSDCPDKRCVKQGFSNSLPIICLPNRLVLEIRSHKQPKALILQ